MNTNSFLYEIGDKVILTGLQEYPELNGIICTISGHRPLEPNVYCKSGRAYYIEEDLDWGLHYIYQEKLRPVPPHNKANAAEQNRALSFQLYTSAQVFR